MMFFNLKNIWLVSDKSIKRKSICKLCRVKKLVLFHNCIEEQREQKCGKIYQWTKYKENNCTSCIINKK
jgi:hypothetical protein